MSMLAMLFCVGLAVPQAAPDPGLTNELKALRREFFDAQRTRDRSTLERVLAPGFTFSHSSGRLERREGFIARMADPGTAPPPDIEFTEDELRLYGDDTVIWTTRSFRKGTDVQFRSTDVLVKQGGRWMWAAVHSTRIPE